ncbi:endospore germination permease [Cytobacillus sp. Hz8]|uniref:GerAB/ArcD/ProY family transporter n=1 Tax=Cytobacillus sp. Hz8 TaxID=3347168 RepID=UPI0035D5C3BA
MLEKGKISKGQFMILIFLFMIGSSTLIATPMVINQAKQDGWISGFMALGFGLILVRIYGSLAKHHPNETLIEICQSILGKWLGKFVAFLYFLFFLILTSGLVRIIGDLITTKIMTETPMIAIEIAFIIIVIYGVYLGLETFARTAEMVLPWVLMFFILVMLSLIPEIEMKNILPILDGGFNPSIRGTYRLMGIPYLDIVIFLMISPYVVNSVKIGKELFISTFVGGTLLTCVITLAIVVLGTELSSKLNYPLFDLAQRIDIGNFIQRIEVLSGGIVFIAMFIKIVISYYSMILSLAQILELKKFNILSIPLGILVLTFSLFLFPNIIYFQMFTNDVWTPFSFIYGFFFPLLLLIVDIMKRKIGSLNRRPKRLL